MRDIQMMVFLGIIAGFIAIFWTRLIRRNMIFRKIGATLQRWDNNHIIMFKEGSLLVKFLRCSFCLQVWLVFLLELFYIVEYRPCFIYAIIGVIGGLGAGNIVCELINSLRNEE